MSTSTYKSQWITLIDKLGRYSYTTLGPADEFDQMPRNMRRQPGHVAWPEWAKDSLKLLREELVEFEKDSPELLRHMVPKKIEYTLADMDQQTYNRDIRGVDQNVYTNQSTLLAEAISEPHEEKIDGVIKHRVTNRIVFFNPLYKTKTADEKPLKHETAHIYDTDTGFTTPSDQPMAMPSWQHGYGRVSNTTFFAMVTLLDILNDQEAAAQGKPIGKTLKLMESYRLNPNYNFIPEFYFESLAYAMEDTPQAPSCLRDEFVKHAVTFDLSLNRPRTAIESARESQEQTVKRRARCRGKFKELLDTLSIEDVLLLGAANPDNPALAGAVEPLTCWADTMEKYLRVFNHTRMDHPRHPGLPMTPDEIRAFVKEGEGVLAEQVAKFRDHLPEITAAYRNVIRGMPQLVQCETDHQEQEKRGKSR